MANDLAISERTLPHDLNAERAVLGAAMVWANVWPQVASTITADSFYRDAHRRIFLAMAALAEDAVALDFITVKNRLAQTGELDECGGPAYLSAMTDGLPSHANVKDWADIVSEKARLRAVVFASNRLTAQAYEAEDTAAQIVEQAVQLLLAFSDTRRHVVSKAGDEAIAYAMALDEPATDALSCGFVDLDDMLAGGIRKDELTILAGRPGSGKTSLGLSIARGLARNGHPTVVFSLEMKSRELVGRMIAWDSHVDHSRMRARFLDAAAKERIVGAVRGLQGLPLYFQDSAATLTEVSAWCERLSTDSNVECVVIDYLQLLLPEKRSSSREADVAAISRGLKRLAKGRAVIALSQLNRSPEDRRDNRPKLSDLRESGTLEQDCDVAVLLFRPEQYDAAEELQGIAEVIVAKNRQGQTGTTKLAFIASRGGAFENLAMGGS